MRMERLVCIFLDPSSSQNLSMSDATKIQRKSCIIDRTETPPLYRHLADMWTRGTDPLTQSVQLIFSMRPQTARRLQAGFPTPSKKVVISSPPAPANYSVLNAHLMTSSGGGGRWRRDALRPIRPVCRAHAKQQSLFIHGQTLHTYVHYEGAWTCQHSCGCLCFNSFSLYPRWLVVLSVRNVAQTVNNN